MATFDITNNSWGYSGYYDDFLNLADPGSVASLEGAGFAHATVQGRDGLGTIILKAAGNGANNAQGEGHNSLHTIITVAATDETGDAADYSNWGTNILVTAPAAAVTTDREGNAGYETGDYTDSFDGTSAATPVVSGVVALMLEANPELGWRDVQNILAISASHTGSDHGSAGTGFEVGDWFTNGADNWNGGGMTFHLSYGFGMVDVFAAVRMAEVWGEMHGAAAVTDNEAVVHASYTGGPVAITDHATSTITINVTEGVVIEHIYVTLAATHSYMGDLTIELEAPTGEVFELFLQEPDGQEMGTWTYGVTAALETSSLGEWSLHVSDGADYDTGVITGLDLEFRGSAQTSDTVHHITADFDDYADQEAARRNITDTDGGIDWINMASIAGDVEADLADGGAIRVDGENWTTITGGHFENLVTGDGADTVNGNSRDNILRGARGNDRVEGRNGDDSLHGNEGNDTLNGESGDDWASGGSGNDLLLGRDGDDTMRGSNGDDRFYGGADNDLIAGNPGDDTLNGGSGDDRLFGGGGDDVLDGGRGSDTMAGGAGADVFVFNEIDDSPHGAGRDTITDFETGVDTIDLSGFAGTLTFVGAYTGTAGEVRYNDAVGRLYIDVDGDMASDFSVDLTPGAGLAVDDLIL